MVLRQQKRALIEEYKRMHVRFMARAQRLREQEQRRIAARIRRYLLEIPPELHQLTLKQVLDLERRRLVTTQLLLSMAQKPTTNDV